MPGQKMVHDVDDDRDGREHDAHADGRQHLHLRLFHNQNGVPEYYGYQAYLSIPLKTNPYRLHSGDTVSVRINTYNGEVLKTFVY